MSYNKQIQKLRSQLTSLIIESVRAAGNHISTYYKSTGVPYKNVVKEKCYGSAPLRGTFEMPWDVDSYIIMHLAVSKKNELKIIYIDDSEEHSTTIDKLTLESLYAIVKWLQFEMLLLAPRKVQTCYNCGCTKVQKWAGVNINDDNVFVKYFDEIGTEGNFCPKCTNIHISFVEYNETDIPIKILNHWWGGHTEDQKSRMIRHFERYEGTESFTPNDIWVFATSTEIKRKIWCNYREI